MVCGTSTMSQRCPGAERARRRRGRVPVTGLKVVLCLAGMGLIDPGPGAQELGRPVMAPTVLTVEQEKAHAAKPGSDFKECANGCPVMIVIPAGKFTMGSPENEADRLTSEGPQHEVTFAQPFAVSKFEVTFAEWDACSASGGCPRAADGWGRGEMPVINVSWGDAKRFVGWLSQATGREYRLLTEAEWEYAARAGANTRYSWGDDPHVGNANCNGCGSHGISSKRHPLDRSSQTRSGFTTCTATSGSGLRITGTTVTRVRQRTDQHGFGAAIQVSASSAVAPGASRASSCARPYASSAISTCNSTHSGSG